MPQNYRQTIIDYRPTNDDRLPTNDDQITINDDQIPTNDDHKASIYLEAIELPTVSAKVEVGGDTPHTSTRPCLHACILWFIYYLMHLFTHFQTSSYSFLHFLPFLGYHISLL